MNPELKAAIASYVETSQRLFTQLAIDLEIRLPITVHDWAQLKIEWSGTSKTGIKYRKHGYGVEMLHQDETIDFDIGKNGELDGIDPWRLFYFAEDNGIPLPYKSVSEVQNEFKRVSNSSELIYSGYILYYAS